MDTTFIDAQHGTVQRQRTTRTFTIKQYSDGKVGCFTNTGAAISPLITTRQNIEDEGTRQGLSRAEKDALITFVGA